MKALLFLNGPNSCQESVEDGFNHCVTEGILYKVDFFYYEDYAKTRSIDNAIIKMFDLVKSLMPDLIILFHFRNFQINKTFFEKIKSIAPHSKIVYDEGDMYGGIFKPITSTMKICMRAADVISIRGLGCWYDKVSSFKKKVIYTPHCASLNRITDKIELKSNKSKKSILIGNSVYTLFKGLNFLPGSRGRVKLVKALTRSLGNRFSVYGSGWNKFKSNRGQIPFQQQAQVCNDNWVQVAYEHYPGVSYYFSDRLPIALSCGQIYICHFHEGYDQIFKGCDFIYFFKTSQEAIDIINYLFSLDENALMEKSNRARHFAQQYFHPKVIWKNFVLEVIN
jgi:hypothetical protein